MENICFEIYVSLEICLKESQKIVFHSVWMDLVVVVVVLVLKNQEDFTLYTATYLS